MTDKQIKNKLNQLKNAANALHEEPQRRYVTDGFLFFESDGAFHMMDGDDDNTPARRQEHIRFSSDGFCHMGAGAW